jgi:hypothetical protein
VRSRGATACATVVRTSSFGATVRGVIADVPTAGDVAAGDVAAGDSGAGGVAADGVMAGGVAAGCATADGVTAAADAVTAAGNGGGDVAAGGLTAGGVTAFTTAECTAPLGEARGGGETRGAADAATDAAGEDAAAATLWRISGAASTSVGLSSTPSVIEPVESLVAGPGGVTALQTGAAGGRGCALGAAGAAIGGRGAAGFAPVVAADFALVVGACGPVGRAATFACGDAVVLVAAGCLADDQGPCVLPWAIQTRCTIPIWQATVGAQLCKNYALGWAGGGRGRRSTSSVSVGKDLPRIEQSFGIEDALDLAL